MRIPLNLTKQIPLSTIQAIIGLKISECDLKLEKFPANDYARGERDMAVNILKALLKAAEIK